MHATDFLKEPSQHAHVAVAVLCGPETHLRSQARKAMAQALCGEASDDADLGLTVFNGKDADFKSVSDELLTVSMFGDHRVVIVEDADDFVSKNRPQLERYVEKPSKKATLILDVKSWPKNTKLAKKIVTSKGLTLECSELSGAALYRWISDVAESEFEKKLSKDAASAMVQLAGSSLGLLRQEVEKLANYVGDRERITPEDVRTLVGGWKAETTWVMLNAARDGQIGHALECLDQLFAAGEAPQRLLGGLNHTFRKIAMATEGSRGGRPLSAALKNAGVYYRDAGAVEKYLRRIGRPRAEMILHRLAKADRNMKGGTRVPERIQLEQLLVIISGAKS
ncbi:MAG: DNA polymerase III subunit delta [Planctomycetaceae bacterium]